MLKFLVEDIFPSERKLWIIASLLGDYTQAMKIWFKSFGSKHSDNLT